MIRIVIIDDHVVVRLGLQYMLKFDPEITCVGELAKVDGAGAYVRDCGADVTLLDLKMPGVGGIGALRDIRTVDPEAKVLVLTTSNMEEDIYAAIAGGAKGYVLKDSPPQEILGAIRTVAAGGECFSDEIRRTYALRKESKSLSERELEVMRLVVRGLRNREIGEHLGVTENSIKMHLKHVFAKLQVADRAEAVTAVLARGIITT